MLYPEQNEARLKLSLNGTWEFTLGSCDETRFDPAKPLPDAQPIAVPASYNDQNDQTTAPPLRLGMVSAQSHPARLLRRAAGGAAVWLCDPHRKSLAERPAHCAA